MNNVLITGGAGFIGSHVVRDLLANGDTVTVFDSFETGSRDALPSGIEVLEADIRDLEALHRAMEGKTHVVHLAALVSVPRSIEDPGLTEAVNVEGTRNVLAAAKEAGVSRLVYASSAAVYGNDPSLPKREDSPLLPESPYASSKIANELDAAAFLEHGLSSMGLRFFNVYGPGQAGSHPYASVVPRFVEAARANVPIHLYGDGSQTRDFVHVRDVASAVRSALASGTDGVANIASGEQLSLAALIELLGAIRGSELAIERLPDRPGDIKHSVAHIGTAQGALSFKPSVTLEDGLRELLS